MKLAILISSFLILSRASASAMAVVTVSPQIQTITPGTTATVQIAISGLGLNTAPSLGAYDLAIAFNPAVLSFTGLTFGDPVQGDQLDLSGAGTVSDFSTPQTGILDFFEISLDPASLLDAQQSNHFILATAAFSAIGVGNSSLQPIVNSIADSAGASLLMGLQSGSINVAPVPEPNMLALLMPLAVLLYSRRSRSSFWPKRERLNRLRFQRVKP